MKTLRKFSQGSNSFQHLGPKIGIIFRKPLDSVIFKEYSNISTYMFVVFFKYLRIMHIYLDRYRDDKKFSNKTKTLPLSNIYTF